MVVATHPAVLRYHQGYSHSTQAMTQRSFCRAAGRGVSPAGPCTSRSRQRASPTMTALSHSRHTHRGSVENRHRKPSMTVREDHP